MGTIRTLWLGVVFGFLIVPTIATAQTFTTAFQTTGRSEVRFVSNAIVTCDPTHPECTNAQNLVGPIFENDSIPMVFIDQDSDGSTFNSSSADFVLPTGSTVEWAGLYWAARFGDFDDPVKYTAAPNPSAIGTMRLRTPLGGYNAINGTVQTVDDGYYQAFADVTSRVQSGGAGTYWGADIQTSRGRYAFGGWALVIVYANPNADINTVTVAHGLREVGYVNDTISIQHTIQDAAAQSWLGLIAYDGEIGDRDKLSLDGERIVPNEPDPGAPNPPADIMNSSIGFDGVNATNRSPFYRNTLGWDADFFDTTGIAIDGIADLSFTADPDKRFVGVFAFQTAVEEPVLEVTKTTIDFDGGDILPGDQIGYEIIITNTGSGPATNVQVQDALPTGTLYEGQNLYYNDGSGYVVLTNAVDGDRGEFVSDTFTVRVGSVPGVNGGTVTAGQSVRVGIIVRADCVDATSIEQTDWASGPGTISSSNLGAETGFGTGTDHIFYDASPGAFRTAQLRYQDANGSYEVGAVRDDQSDARYLRSYLRNGNLYPFTNCRESKSFIYRDTRNGRLSWLHGVNERNAGNGCSGAFESDFSITGAATIARADDNNEVSLTNFDHTFNNNDADGHAIRFSVAEFTINAAIVALTSVTSFESYLDTNNTVAPLDLSALPASYFYEGNLNSRIESAIFDTGAPRNWGILTATGSQHDGGNGIEVYIRAGTSVANTQTKLWEGPFALGTDVSNAAVDGNQFVQYAIDFTLVDPTTLTNFPEAFVEIESVTLFWEFSPTTSPIINQGVVTFTQSGSPQQLLTDSDSGTTGISANSDAVCSGTTCPSQNTFCDTFVAPLTGSAQLRCDEGGLRSVHCFGAPVPLGEPEAVQRTFGTGYQTLTPPVAANVNIAVEVENFPLEEIDDPYADGSLVGGCSQTEPQQHGLLLLMLFGFCLHLNRQRKR